MCITVCAFHFLNIYKKKKKNSRILHIDYQKFVLRGYFESFAIFDFLYIHIQKHRAIYAKVCQIVWLDI